MNLIVKFKDKNVYKELKSFNGDWVDLRVNDTVTLKKGEFKILDLGIAMQLPKGYEAIVAPRSSTFKNYGLIQTNSIGVIDNAYCGDDDWWGMPVLATRDVTLLKGTRVCQFRLLESMPSSDIKVAKKLNTSSRGGFGSTGDN